MSELPVELTCYFADSRLALESFDKPSARLTIRIEKEIGPESGLICFHGVSYLALPTVCSGEQIQAIPLRAASADFWSRCKMPQNWFDGDDVVFEIEDQEGVTQYVVAKSLEYQSKL